MVVTPPLSGVLLEQTTNPPKQPIIPPRPVEVDVDVELVEVVLGVVGLGVVGSGVVGLGVVELVKVVVESPEKIRSESDVWKVKKEPGGGELHVLSVVEVAVRGAVKEGLGLVEVVRVVSKCSTGTVIVLVNWHVPTSSLNATFSVEVTVAVHCEEVVVI